MKIVEEEQMKRLRMVVAGMCAALLLIAVGARAESAGDKDKKEEKHLVQTIPASGKDATPVGASTCLQCHQDRENFHNNIHGKALPNAKGIDFEQSCEMCHGNGSLHAGAGGDKNNADFWTIKNPTKMKPAEVSETCMQCHSGGQRMHWLGSTHEAKNVSCTQCHSIHDEKANGGKAPLLKKASEAETCYQCHAEKKAQIRKSAHMPLVEGKMGCTSCHQPHGTPVSDKLLAKNSVTETCYQCHEDKRGPFLWEHPPVQENCLNCHDPHGSHNEYQLVDKMPMLCQRCHVGTTHFSNLYDNTAISQFNNRVIGDSCVNCHSRIHGSNHPSGKRFQR